MVKVLRPQVADVQARQAGMTRPDICRAIEAAIEGTRTGVYREKDELLPIVARQPESERVDLSRRSSEQSRENPDRFRSANLAKHNLSH